MQQVTESRGSFKAKQALYSCAGNIAIRQAQNNSLPITCVEGTNIVKKYPDGTREILGSVNEDYKPQKRFLYLATE